MALPPSFTIPEHYFEESIKFLKEFQHLYKFPNTDVLVNNVLDNIGYLENMDSSEIDFDITALREKEFLKEFFAKVDSLIPFHDDFEHEMPNIDIDAPLSPKKRHEIIYLAREIQEICRERSCDTVVDFGSGLGYLDQMLYQTTNLKVLGVECNENHYVGAKKRQRKYHLNSIDRVKYIKHFISDTSNVNIEQYLCDKFKDHRGFCITGLHACADLTIDAIKLFLKMADSHCIVLMPCCYHKMKIEDSFKRKFVNFPLSCCLKEAFEKYEAFEYMDIPFLRLAAQPKCRTENLEDAVFNLLARGVLQVYAYRHNLKIRRNKRKAVKTNVLNNSFTDYLRDAVNGFSLFVKNESAEKVNFDVKELQTIWRETQILKQRAAIFVLLQNFLQPVIENFVLYDRLIYLKENGVQCRFKKVFKEVISPRCLALIAYK